jgi:hypothetical protein
MNAKNNIFISNISNGDPPQPSGDPPAALLPLGDPPTGDLE